ncbi:hypothetical protein JL721_5667 [Aureococcus anophagefferens]|nr:hypothetical protein JL721_5667 [Aureococcus anophagefferens]
MVNTQVAISAATAVGLIYSMRTCEWMTFVALVIVPGVLYALLAEQTKATKLRGKTVLVTGSSPGLGLALAREAAKRGAAKVVLASRTKAAPRRLCGRRDPRLLRGRRRPCDVTKPDDVRALLKNLPPVDVLVNNAGAGAWKHVEETTPEEAYGMMACPYQAAFTMTSLLVPTMVARATDCHVVNVTSAASEVGFRGAVGYATARWAMRGFSRMLAQDLKQLGIGVTHLNAAEISGTSYFSDAPGKAGAASHAKIPYLFQLVDGMGLNYTTTQVAAAALDGVEKGWSTVLVPGFLLIPTKMVADVVPCFLEFLCGLGPAGRRAI